MKKFLMYVIGLGICFNIQAQNDNYAKRMKHIFGAIDKTKVTTGYLKEFGIRIVNIEACNGLLSSENHVSKSDWKALYSSLYTMRIGTVANDMASPEVAYTKLQTPNQGVVDIALLHYHYQQYKPNAYTNRDVWVKNDRIYDVPGRNPYQTKTAFAIAPLQQQIKGNSVRFRLPNSLFYSNNKTPRQWRRVCQY